MKIYTSDTKECEIHNLDEWFTFCPPEGKEAHWKDGRSAKEMAKFWLNKNHCEKFKKFIRPKFDSFKKPRQHDLLISEKNNKTIITVEGKVDEPFGNGLFGENFKKTIDEKISNNNSKSLDRMINLYQNYFKNNCAVLSIMYQLTYWFAGSLHDAIKFDTENIVMVLHEFRNNTAAAEKLQKNHAEFDKFINFISNESLHDYL